MTAQVLNRFIAPCGHPGEPIIGTFVRCFTCDVLPKKAEPATARTLPNVTFTITNMTPTAAPNIGPCIDPTFIARAADKIDQYYRLGHTFIMLRIPKALDRVKVGDAVQALRADKSPFGIAWHLDPNVHAALLEDGAGQISYGLGTVV